MQLYPLTGKKYLQTRYSQHSFLTCQKRPIKSMHFKGVYSLPKIFKCLAWVWMNFAALTRKKLWASYLFPENNLNHCSVFTYCYVLLKAGAVTITVIPMDHKTMLLYWTIWREKRLIKIIAISTDHIFPLCVYLSF